MIAGEARSKFEGADHGVTQLGATQKPHFILNPSVAGPSSFIITIIRLRWPSHKRQQQWLLRNRRCDGKSTLLKPNIQNYRCTGCVERREGGGNLSAVVGFDNPRHRRALHRAGTPG
jgi:hypothetical protein